MPKHKSSRKAVHSSITVPTPDVVQEVVRNLKLAKTSGELLELVLPDLANELKIAIDNGDHDLTTRRRMRKENLKRMTKCLRDFYASIAALDQAVFREVLSRELGLLASTHAFEQVVSQELGDGLARQGRLSRDAEFSRSGPYRPLEREVEFQRIELGARYGQAVLANIIAQFLTRAERHLKEEGSYKGGSPGDPVRTFVLHRVIPIHNRLCELDETRRVADYEALAEQVLAALGLSTDGLEAAIGRMLRKLQSRNPSPV